ncbi:unnamed protein product [Onchocerca flexuosa]|uniref:Uncharacterized protein n=1 Tax=Onchocerca flexuosa TaxID=387005 RepID=A0A183HEY8_9BILA|nr:unnamed protein product [Onchocerca flexuosa]
MTQSSTLLEPSNDEVYEFDVDLLYSWEQSSGTISYEAWSSNLEEAFHIDKDGKMLPDYNDNICRAKINQRLLRHSMPAYKTLTARSLAMLNEAKRRERIQGHLFQRIVIPCKQDASMERYEFISKICDDAISEYMAATNLDNKLLKINLECGGNLPPRIKINGIRAERSVKYENDRKNYPDISQEEQQVYKMNHSFQHLSTCSPALPYPSANTFSRCSIENYVKLLKGRRKTQEQQ